jgi:hypothetical protein
MMYCRFDWRPRRDLKTGLSKSQRATLLDWITGVFEDGGFCHPAHMLSIEIRVTTQSSRFSSPLFLCQGKMSYVNPYAIPENGAFATFSRLFHF